MFYAARIRVRDQHSPLTLQVLGVQLGRSALRFIGEQLPALDVQRQLEVVEAPNLMALRLHCQSRGYPIVLADFPNT